MLTSRRDYILRIIDEVGRILARVVFKRRTGADQEALETVVIGFQRLFDLDPDHIFQFTPEQHYRMLADEASPLDARDKILLYAALSAEAGAIYAKRGNLGMARATRLNALRFTLKARRDYPTEGAPAYAPEISALVEALADEPLDPDTTELLRNVAAEP